jgi:hypothetical protein
LNNYFRLTQRQFSIIQNTNPKKNKYNLHEKI